MDQLPQSFKDAFYVAEKLGFRYVWIDSLCIIQDTGDWKQEAYKMAQHYQHSTLTIAAMSSKLGLFPKVRTCSNRPPQLTRLPYRDPKGVRKGYFYVYPARELGEEGYSRTLQTSHLLTRAWVFQ